MLDDQWALANGEIVESQNWSAMFLRPAAGNVANVLLADCILISKVKRKYTPLCHCGPYLVYTLQPQYATAVLFYANCFMSLSLAYILLYYTL